MYLTHSLPGFLSERVRLKAKFRSLLLYKITSYFFESLCTVQYIQLLLTEVYFVEILLQFKCLCNNSRNLKLDRVTHESFSNVIKLCYCNMKPDEKGKHKIPPWHVCLTQFWGYLIYLTDPPFLRYFAFPSRKLQTKPAFDGRFRLCVCLSWVFVS